MRAVLKLLEQRSSAFTFIFSHEGEDALLDASGTKNLGTDFMSLANHGITPCRPGLSAFAPSCLTDSVTEHGILTCFEGMDENYLTFIAAQQSHMEIYTREAQPPPFQSMTEFYP